MRPADVQHRTKGRGQNLEDQLLTLYRNPQEVFGEGGAAACTAIRAYTGGCVLAHCPCLCWTRRSGKVRQTCAHLSLHVIRPWRATSCITRILAWGSGPKAKPDYTGLDVVIVRDGKIAALYVFLNPKFA
jgi:hypothetical protein